VLVASAVTYLSVARSSDAETRQTLAAVADNADSVREAPSGVWLVVRSPHGKVRRSPGLPAALSSQRLLALAPRRGALVQKIHVGSGDFLVRAQVRGHWVVAAVKDLSLRLNEQRRLGWGLALASLFGLVVAVLVGDLLAGRATRPLAEALNRQRRFVADASHELRTPLAILKAEVDLALVQGRSAAELHDALSSVSEETDRLIQLAEDLLTLAQTDQGELQVRLVRADVGEILQGVALRFSGRAGERGRAIEVSSEPGLEAPVDRLRLDQALGNLVDNALRYGKGPVELRPGLPRPRLRALQPP
jgi:signal transduction histidine kinase